MPSSATITAFYTFVANEKARASEVNNNFSLYRGHVLPIEPLTATSSDITYDLGSREHSWRVGYLKSLQVRCATSTADFVLQGQTAVTAGAAEFLFGSSTIGVIGVTGIHRLSLESAADRMTVTAAGTGAFVVTMGTTAPFWFDVTALNLTITVKKSLVEISFFQDSTTQAAFFGVDPGTSNFTLMDIRLYRNTTTSVVNGGPIKLFRGITGSSYEIAPTAIRWIDDPGAGSHTYQVQVGNSHNDTMSTMVLKATNIKMRVREL